MKENTNKLKETAQGMTVVFGAFAVFVLLIGAVLPLLDFIKSGDLFETVFFKYFGAIVCFASLAVSFIIMSKSLFKISKEGNPFSEKNIKTFKLSGKVMSYGGFLGSLILFFCKNSFDDEYLEWFWFGIMEGIGMGLAICGAVFVMFLELLRYGSKVQDELDTIA